MAKYAEKRSRVRRENDEIEKSYRGMSPAPNNSRYNKRESAKRRGAIIAICVMAIILAIAVTVACILFLNEDDDGLILNNITVAGVDVGGLSKADAISLVRSATKNTFGKEKMIVTVEENIVEIPADCVRSFDAAGAVQTAYDYGRKGSLSKREQEKEIAATTGYAVDLTPFLNIDETTIQSILGALGEKYNSILSQSTYEVVGNTPTAAQIKEGINLQKLVVTVGRPEYGLDMETLYRNVMAAYTQNKFEASGSCEIIEPDPLSLNAILSKYYIAPIDAEYDYKNGKIIDGIYGYGFDVQLAATLLENAAYGSVVEIPFMRITPEYTADNLYEKMFKDVLGTFTAEETSDPDRDTNLRVACKAINGLVLNPGEIFSYNKTLGERTTANGYRPGPSYSGNQTVYTIGGGICQVSSALYYCALVADLEILTRENHGFAPSYAPLGIDATVSWDYLDFRFRNNSKNAIQIVATAEGGKTTISILGIDDKDYYVKMESEILKEYPSGTTYQTMSPDNPDGYKNGDYIVTPYTGYDIKTYRCKYNKQTDELISREFEASSSYRKRDAVICEITGSFGGNDNSSSTPSTPGIGGNGGVSDSGGLPPE